jgi:CHAD domain-containing protein
VSTEVKRLSRQLKSKRRALLRDYRDEDLHKLRISLRRIRSLLKQQPDDEARRLRRELGRMAAATNDARDWDTCYARIAHTLGKEDCGAIEPLVAACRSRAHRRVRRMLRSKRWSRAVKRWRQYARGSQLESTHPAGETQDPGGFEERLFMAARQALARDDDKSWHKLRIAVKELRYQLDSTADGSPQPGSEEMLQQCKRLQADLGDWHDTVVHHGLLQELNADLKPNADVESRDIIAKLCHQAAQEGSEILARVRVTLEEGAHI